MISQYWICQWLMNTLSSWQNCEDAEGILVILLLSSLPYCSGEKEPLRAAANRRRGRCEASHLSTNQKQGRCQPCHLSSWPIGAVDQLLLVLLGTNAVVLTKVCDHLCPCALVQPSVCQSVHTSSIYPFIHHPSIRCFQILDSSRQQHISSALIPVFLLFGNLRHVECD